MRLRALCGDVVKPQWVDPFSPRGKREATAKILTGTNYRLFFEGATRRKLITTYRELAQMARQHPHDNIRWKENIKKLLQEGSSTEKNLRHWLIGLTKKTADNLGIKTAEYPKVFDQLIADIESYPANSQLRDTALLLWSGAATLTVRGAQKSKVGKALEKSVVRAALTIIDLDEGDAVGNFRLSIGADEEVLRETDAEIRTKRGKIRIEVALIGKGNPEVIGDKIGRMTRNDVILCDILPKGSNMWHTAEQCGVKLIQMRNNHPVEELRQHLFRFSLPVSAESIEMEEVVPRVMAIPLQAFAFS